MTLEGITSLRVRVNRNEVSGHYLQGMAWNTWPCANNPGALSIVEGITTRLGTSGLSGEWNTIWVSPVERKRGEQAGK